MNTIIIRILPIFLPIVPELLHIFRARENYDHLKIDFDFTLYAALFLLQYFLRHQIYKIADLKKRTRYRRIHNFINLSLFLVCLPSFFTSTIADNKTYQKTIQIMVSTFTVISFSAQVVLSSNMEINENSNDETLPDNQPSGDPSPNNPDAQQNPTPIKNKTIFAKYKKEKRKRSK